MLARVAIVIAGCALILGCEETAGPDVGETETWRIELLQVDDGVSPAYPRRGIMTFKLEANRVEHPDPTCTGPVTTFVASVEALPSRLQERTFGSADGSWNCHGAVMTIRLPDGLTYDLRSDENPIDYWTTNQTWTSGTRAGVFTFRRQDGPQRESHVDVTLRNTTGDDWDVLLNGPCEFFDGVWQHHLINCPDEQWLRVSANTTTSTTWLAHVGKLQSENVDISAYDIILRQPGDDRHPDPDICFLGRDHPDRLEVIIEDGGTVQCGEGWIGRAYVEAARNNLYMQAVGDAMRDTVTLAHIGFQQGIRIESVSDPSITATCFDCTVPSSIQPRSALLTVDAAPDSPRNVHEIVVVGIIPSGEPLEFHRFEDIISVWVYELHASADSTSLTIPASQTGSTLIRLSWVGFAPGEPLLSVTSAPTGITPTFSDATPDVGTSRLDVRVDSTVAPATYTVAMCATMVVDARRTCSPFSISVVVTQAPPATGNGIIQGYVTGNGDGVGGATVTLSGAVSQTVTTIASGGYIFRSLPPGTYTVSVSTELNITFPANPQTVTIGPGDEVNVNFEGTY